ncbi:hypothetical protein P171DRAFT_58969 [Karstenula rhodostoma CBS 690.94]|uniref:Uncharacterized protein n=1 Tax=Karstenula rhodostoma CBS 690.94 TaxID=1392251 RepID=A0A9P4UAP5_9PLEO|nr:hypothetical protein P171DRAFT_58969 [Karstenula rhodostoma CBS 690.94]
MRKIQIGEIKHLYIDIREVISGSSACMYVYARLLCSRHVTREPARLGSTRSASLSRKDDCASYDAVLTAYALAISLCFGTPPSSFTVFCRGLQKRAKYHI